MYKKILVPMALDHGVSPNTLEVAKALTGGTGQIIALHVYEAPQGSVQAYVDEEVKKEAMARARADLASKTEHLDGVTAEMVVGHTYRSIIDYAADHQVDCIVMGSHKPGFSDYLLGSTAARVVRHAPCAVHVYRSS
ncbi:universal stress protein [Sulfitobacter aestuariivivens]|uniref:Universal stress protein n=1 Tax=Sulfitobacter aestuariivivens TaxID=2766981 RepID=A0A927D2X7_9RHOB|nr:universal stress protein [Sulfitobacter aestuariivivens]MBD3662342.1 universal stress protein [Sulfitobacter aestuariivivens]